MALILFKKASLVVTTIGFLKYAMQTMACFY